MNIEVESPVQDEVVTLSLFKDHERKINQTGFVPKWEADGRSRGFFLAWVSERNEVVYEVQWPGDAWTGCLVY